MPESTIAIVAAFGPPQSLYAPDWYVQSWLDVEPESDPTRS